MNKKLFEEILNGGVADSYKPFEDDDSTDYDMGSTNGGADEAIDRIDLLNDEELEELGWTPLHRKGWNGKGSEIAPWGNDLFKKGTLTLTRWDISRRKDTTNNYKNETPYMADKEYYNSNTGDDGAFMDQDFIDDDSDTDYSDWRNEGARFLNYLDLPLKSQTKYNKILDDEDDRLSDLQKNETEPLL